MSPEGATPYEITCRMFPKMSEMLLYYGLCATTGHLELLETQGGLMYSNDGGVRRYSPVSV